MIGRDEPRTLIATTAIGSTCLAGMETMTGKIAVESYRRIVLTPFCDGFKDEK